jgi:hypothetical protein
LETPKAEREGSEAMTDEELAQVKRIIAHMEETAANMREVIAARDVEELPHLYDKIDVLVSELPIVLKLVRQKVAADNHGLQAISKLEALMLQLAKHEDKSVQ